MAKVLLGATGSVAAIRVPALHAALTQAGHEVQIVATRAATYFFDTAPLRSSLVLDEDEWPGTGYSRGEPVRHIELRRWADLFLLAPLDANTLAKIAIGISDNCLTCVWRAWDWNRPVVLAPAMNTLMWEHPITRKHLRALGADFGAGHIPASFDEAQLIAQINDRAKKLHITGPISKTLACGDEGVGAMAEVEMIIDAVSAMLTREPAA